MQRTDNSAYESEIVGKMLYAPFVSIYTHCQAILREPYIPTGKRD